MVKDAEAARGGKPVLALSRTDVASVAKLKEWVLAMTETVRSGHHTPVDPGPMAPHSHVGDDGELITHTHAHAH
jgi:urease accessory protein